MSKAYNSLPTEEYDDETSGQSFHFDRRIRQQDENLDALGGSVLRLGQISLSISQEIDSQNKLLTVLDEDMETANDNIARITESTKAMVKKAGGPKTFCIIVALWIVLLFLVFLFIYT
jgi:syntaxin 8